MSQQRDTEQFITVQAEGLYYLILNARALSNNVIPCVLSEFGFKYHVFMQIFVSVLILHLTATQISWLNVAIQMPPYAN